MLAGSAVSSHLEGGKEKCSVLFGFGVFSFLELSCLVGTAGWAAATLVFRYSVWAFYVVCHFKSHPLVGALLYLNIVMVFFLFEASESTLAFLALKDAKSRPQDKPLGTPYRTQHSCWVLKRWASFSPLLPQAHRRLVCSKPRIYRKTRISHSLLLDPTGFCLGGFLCMFSQA